MRIVCITLSAGAGYTRVPGGNAVTDTHAHFAARGVQAQFFEGFYAAKLGLATTRPYTHDDPDSNTVMEPRKVGCWVSHRAVWSALLALTEPQEELFLVVEDDVEFPVDWRTRIDTAIEDAGDFDILFVGSCCTHGKPRTRVRGDVYDVRYPMCAHGLVIRRRALSTLIETSDRAGCYAPIDISLVLHTLPELRAYTVLPRILTQRGTDLVE